MTSKKPMAHYYITKYALTRGIIEIPESRVTVLHEIKEDGSMIRVANDQSIEHFFKPHWYTRECEAIERAKQMAKAKLRSLAKQMDKYRRFNPKFVE